ncbi:winged helix-turn-helix transcriptional regulator [bacterium]|nr:winged helix-turn-helix transcriptional regulator [bacterium]
MNKLKLEEVSELIRQTHIAVSGFYNEFAKSVGMTLAEFKVLAIIWKEETSTQKRITQMTYLPKQTVNAIIMGFLKKGFIELMESNLDKRNKVISFTNMGQKYADKIILKAKEIEYNALSALGEERIKLFLEAITMYKNNLKME